MKKRYKKNDEETSLLDAFKLGDRVKQIYYDPDGYEKIYSGRVVQIKKHCMAIQWDTINGHNRSELMDKYSVCHVYEVFNGDRYYSPITKEN